MIPCIRKGNEETRNYYVNWKYRSIWLIWNQAHFKRTFLNVNSLNTMELTIHTRKSAMHSFYLISLIHVVVPFFHWHTCHNIFLRNVNHHRQECVRLLCLSFFGFFWSKCFEYEGPKNNNERKVDNIRVERKKKKTFLSKIFQLIDIRNDDD